MEYCVLGTSTTPEPRYLILSTSPVLTTGDTSSTTTTGLTVSILRGIIIPPVLDSVKWRCTVWILYALTLGNEMWVLDWKGKEYRDKPSPHYTVFVINISDNINWMKTSISTNLNHFLNNTLQINCVWNMYGYSNCPCVIEANIYCTCIICKWALEIHYSFILHFWSIS